MLFIMIITYSIYMNWNIYGSTLMRKGIYPDLYGACMERAGINGLELLTLIPNRLNRQLNRIRLFQFEKENNGAENIGIRL